MISAYTFMYFPQYIVGVFPCDALEDGYEKTSPVKASLMNSKPGRPRSKLRSLFRVVGQQSFYYIVPNGVHPARLRHDKGDFLVIEIYRGLCKVLDRR